MTREERELSIEYLEKIKEDYIEGNAYERHPLPEYYAIENAIKALEQEPKTGHWIKEESICGWDGHSYQCSECGRSIHLDTEVEDLEDYPYCHCGAKMQEVEE